MKTSFFHSIRWKILLTVLVSGLVALFLTGYLVNHSLQQLEVELTEERLTADLNYLKDKLGRHGWSVKNGSLYHGKTLIGDGTEEHANHAPFRDCEKKTGTYFVISMIKMPEGGLKWVGDDKTGYQQGPFMRVAGSFTGPAKNRVITGTYYDKKVTDILEKYGEYSGVANVNGVMTLSKYEVFRDDTGKPIGSFYVGRSLEGMAAQVSRIGGVTLFAIISVMVFTMIAILWLMNRWVRVIERLKGHFISIAEGEYPEKPLEIHTRDEMGEMAEAVNEMTESLKEKDRVDTELQLAREIQMDFMPTDFPRHESIGIYASMLPAREVGGDFYDFFKVDEKHYAVVIADVSGKGVPSALVMVIAKAIIKNFAELGFGPAEIFSRVNRQIYKYNTEMFVTAWLGIINVETGVIRFVNAGHNPPLMRRACGMFEFVRTRPNLVLVAMEDTEYTEHELVLRPGESILLYTDGITEASDIRYNMYGEERLQDFLNTHRFVSEHRCLDALRADVKAFAGEAEQSDDITMLMLTFNGPTGQNG